MWDWLTVDGYKAWARVYDQADDAAIAEAVDATKTAIELRAPLAFTVDELEQPLPVPPDVLYAGYLWVNRLLDRRNSPAGVVGVAELGMSTIRAYDADIMRLLAPWTEPVLA